MDLPLLSHKHMSGVLTRTRKNHLMILYGRHQLKLWESLVTFHRSGRECCSFFSKQPPLDYLQSTKTGDLVYDQKNTSKDMGQKGCLITDSCLGWQGMIQSDGYIHSEFLPKEIQNTVITSHLILPSPSLIVRLKHCYMIE